MTFQHKPEECSFQEPRYLLHLNIHSVLKVWEYLEKISEYFNILQGKPKKSSPHKPMLNTDFHFYVWYTYFKLAINLYGYLYLMKLQLWGNIKLKCEAKGLVLSISTEIYRNRVGFHQQNTGNAIQVPVLWQMDRQTILLQSSGGAGT